MTPFDIHTCKPLFERLASGHVWQVPTFVQFQAFVTTTPPAAWLARRDYVSPGLWTDWETSAKEADPAALANGRRFLGIQTATLNPRLYSGHDRGKPLIGAGERSDLVLFAADPTADIAGLATIRGVVARGLYHDRASLDEMLIDAKLRAKNAGK